MDGGRFFMVKFQYFSKSLDFAKSGYQWSANLGIVSKFRCLILSKFKCINQLLPTEIIRKM